MAVTGTLTNREICTRALRKIGVVAIDEDATDEVIEVARVGLYLMLKDWHNHDLNVFLKTSMSVSCTTNANYTLSPVRPMRIESARFNQAGREIPMFRLTRAEYDELPVKTTTGIPTNFYYDRQREDAVFYVWPVLSAVNGETIEITYIREIEDVSLDDVCDVAAEMYNAVVYNLADQLQDDFSINNSRVTARAAMLFEHALAFDREDSVFFVGRG